MYLPLFAKAHYPKRRTILFAKRDRSRKNFFRHSRHCVAGAGIQHNRGSDYPTTAKAIRAVVFPLSPPLTRGQIRGNVGFPRLRRENDGVEVGFGFPFVRE